MAQVDFTGTAPTTDVVDLPSNPYAPTDPKVADPGPLPTPGAPTPQSPFMTPLPPGAGPGTWRNDPKTGAAVWGGQGAGGTINDFFASDWYKQLFAGGREASGQTPPPSTAVPSGGNLKDPSYVDRFIAYWATQPGANASLTRDPGYWRNKILSGELGPDEKYIISKFLLPEGAGVPGGGGGGPAPTGPMNYQQALAYVQQQAGKTLSQADQTALLQKFGGNTGSTFTTAGLDPVVAYLKSAGGGTGGGPGGPTTTRSPFVPLGPGMTGTYDQALQVLKDRYRQYYGTEMPDAQLNAIKQQYGFVPDTGGGGGSAGTPGTRQTATRLDPGMSGTSDQAVAYLQGQAQRVLNRPLSDAEIQQAAALVGYKQGQPVTGAMVNRILDEMDKLAPLTGGTPGTPGTPGTARTYTSNDLNPILQALYTGATTGGAAGPGGPGPGNGNPGGYTDPASKLYLDQLLQRLVELRKPTNDPIENFLKLQALQRFQDLQGPVYTAGEDAALVTQYRDPLTQARDTAKKQAADEMARRNITPESGIFQERMAQIDKGYQTGIAQGANALGVKAVDEKQRRANEALQTLSSLLNVQRSGVDRQNALYDQALQVAKMFPDFDQQRLDALLRASGEGPNSTGTMNNLTELARLGFNINNQSNANSQNNAAMWGQLIGAILGML